MTPACSNSASRLTRGSLLLASKHGEHGHADAHPAGVPAEFARVAERLDVEHGELGHAVVLPPQQHVVARHVELVAHRRERGDPDAEPGELVNHREPQATGLRDQAGHAGFRRVRGERGVEADAGHGHAEAVRTDQPHAVPAAHREQVGARGDVQPGGDHDQGPDAALAALLGHAEDRGGGHRYHGQVGGLGQIEHRGQAVLAADLPGVRVHRIEPAGVAAGADVVHDRPAHGAPPPAGADHHDRIGREHMPQAGGLRAAFTFGHGTQVAVQRGAGVRGGQREGHLEDPVRVVTLDGQPRASEHVLHRLVFRQGLGGERGYLTAPGERDQVLEQQGGDAPVVHVVGHRERDLPQCAVSLSVT